MTDDEIEGLWNHFCSQLSVSERARFEPALALARDIERRTRAQCANEVHEGHQDVCEGDDCDCLNLHRLLRAGDDQSLRASVLRKVNPDTFEVYAASERADERRLCVAIAEHIANQLEGACQTTVLKVAQALEINQLPTADELAGCGCKK
jgi:hypothetical protein